ncbi:serine protease Do/serine protease DegQ [Rhizobium sp. BK313]|uniref:trypsin-like peptidase domain-containing protein n=1 Tax=Rhizobium sp. BK313 TaxID=2587081 RepID=UPI0010608BC7|nr:trypsin-like peptidase domain-containing protein [Rhizobium sp. BK313]MBB3456469.1 serine protease Do/serine protease DegQ [Rhizobium sp. BK313]
MDVMERAATQAITNIRLILWGSHRPSGSSFAKLGFSVAFILFAIVSSVNASKITQPSLAPMVERVVPSVVSIAVQGKAQPNDDSSIEDAAPLIRSQTTGSGVIVDGTNGYILTSNHVVENATGIDVMLANGDAYEGTVAGVDPETDLALIQIKASGLTAARMGDSTKLRVGDYVVAIGNPFGLGQTVTFGIVSALGRAGLGLDGYENFIQTDASINPGNSGGALVNLDGELVGINSAILGPSGGNIGIGFAIPVSMAKDVMEQLIAHGEIRRGQLGVAIQDNNADFEQALAITSSTGALVGEVIPDSAGAKAGIRPGDVIVAINETPIHNASELRMKIAAFPPGTTVKMSVIRPTGKADLIVTLAAALPSRQPSSPIAIEGNGLLALVTLQMLGPDSDAYGKVEGAFVESLSDRSKAAAAGLTAGDVIVSVDQKPVNSPQMIAALTQNEKDLLLLGIFRDGHVRFLIVK